jgi:hypothetical protein
MQEFKKRCEKMLGRVFAAERRKRGADLAGCAVDGRNENQQQEGLPQRTGRPARTRPDQLSDHFIGRGILSVTLPVKMCEQLANGRKWGQDFARCCPTLVLFHALFVIEVIEEALFQAADQAIAVASGHHDDALAPRSVR